MENLLVIYDSLPYLFKGIVVTIEIVGAGMTLRLIEGIHLTIGQVYSNK